MSSDFLCRLSERHRERYPREHRQERTEGGGANRIAAPLQRMKNRVQRPYINRATRSTRVPSTDMSTIEGFSIRLLKHYDNKRDTRRDN